MLNRGKATWCYAEQIVLRCWTSFSSYSRQISRVTHFPWELFHIKVTLSEPPESKSMQINDREKCTYSQIHPCGQLLAAGVCRRLVEASCRCPSPGISKYLTSGSQYSPPPPHFISRAADEFPSLCSVSRQIPLFDWMILNGGPHTGEFPMGVGHRVENGWGLTKVAVVLLNGLIW